MLSAMEFFHRNHGEESFLSKNAIVTLLEDYHREKQKELTQQSDIKPNHNHEEIRKGLNHNHTFGVNLGI